MRYTVTFRPHTQTHMYMYIDPYVGVVYVKQRDFGFRLKVPSLRYLVGIPFLAA